LGKLNGSGRIVDVFRCLLRKFVRPEEEKI
jgi:hypothetical protein